MWAREREVVSFLAGLDPDAFRQKCAALAAKCPSEVSGMHGEAVAAISPSDTNGFSLLS
jgi:hypothetical protein